jgi:hypothetical protein
VSETGSSLPLADTTLYLVGVRLRAAGRLLGFVCDSAKIWAIPFHMVDRVRTRDRVLRFAGVVALLAITCVIFVRDARVAMFRLIFPGVCVSENEATIRNIDGMEFNVVYENCDTLAKEEDVYVYVSKASSGEWFFTRWLNRRTLLVSYDPNGRYEVPLPTIQLADEKKILISIPAVGGDAPYIQTRRWHDVDIEYDIGLKPPP